MSCIHNLWGVCKLNTDFNCQLPSPICAHYCNEQTSVEDKVYCKYCFNSHIYKPSDEEYMDPYRTELTDENDFSSICVGESCEHLRLMISSGYGEPVRIEIDEFLPKLKEWHTFGKYYPKYCPECGRRLDEYEMSEVHS